MARQYAKTILQIKWSSICNELHIDETPHSNIKLALIMNSTSLNVLNMEEVKPEKMNYLDKFK